MPITALDHVNLRTTQLDTMIAWYRDITGLTPGQRPNFPFRGAWLYAGEHAVVHLVEIEGAAGVGAESALKLEHFALRAVGLDSFLATLDATKTPFERTDLPEINLTQLNIWDPDGNHIHVDFPQ